MYQTLKKKNPVEKHFLLAIDNDIEPTSEVKQQWKQYLGINNNRKEE